MRILITGGAGFIGSHLVEKLLALEHQVICVDNLLTSHPGNVSHLMANPKFTWLEADVTQGLDVKGPLDRVLHLASPASPADYERLPLETLRVGSRGTENALELARAKGAAFLLASTSEVYGDPEETPQKEGYWGHVNPIGPRSVYDEAKRYAEAITMAYHRHYGLEVRIARIFNTYGPRMRPNDGRAIPNFITQALKGQPITIYGDGTQTRSFCYIDDMTEGLLRLMLSQEQRPVNLGNPQEFSVLELAGLVQRLTGNHTPLKHLPPKEDDPKRRVPDITRAKKILGWEPQVNLEAGLRKTIQWFRQAQGSAGG